MPEQVQVDAAAVKDFFCYFADITFTAVNQRLPATVNLQADADFILVKLMSTSTDSPLDAQGGALLQIVDQGSQRNLLDNQVPLASITGSGQRPFILPWVHRFPRQGAIGLDITNTGTNTNRIRLTFAGFKVIPVGRL